MKKLVQLVLLSCLIFPVNVFANLVEDVEVVDVKSEDKVFEVKFSAKYQGQMTDFFVRIDGSDEMAFDKLGWVLKKTLKPEQHTLNLDVISFSASPRGSYYRSHEIQFIGTNLRQPNSKSSQPKAAKKGLVKETVRSK